MFCSLGAELLLRVTSVPTGLIDGCIRNTDSFTPMPYRRYDSMYDSDVSTLRFLVSALTNASDLLRSGNMLRYSAIAFLSSVGLSVFAFLL